MTKTANLDSYNKNNKKFDNKYNENVMIFEFYNINIHLLTKFVLLLINKQIDNEILFRNRHIINQMKLQ